MKSYIGLTSYYRRYIPEFSKIAAPLTKLTRKGVGFEWTEECQRAFEELKAALMTEPVLVFPDWNKPFSVYVDASQTAVGGVLVQEHGDGQRAIHYYSRKLTPTQSRWPIIEWEAYAIFEGIRQFKPYLYGHKFTVYSDYQPLRYLFISEIKNVKVQKWAMDLSQYDMTIEYITGAKNKQADFLSRLGSKPKDGNVAEVKVINTDKIQVRKPPPDTNISSELSSDDERPRLDIEGREPLDMKVEQRKDNNLKKVANDISYTQLDGILYYIAEEPVVGLKLVIPEHLRNVVLQACHEDLGQGINKTYDRIRQKYHRSAIYKTVLHYVSKCVPCNSCNLKQQKTPLQKMDTVSVPFQKIAVDICGPYPTTQAGNKYLLTFVDMYSGWTEFFPVPDKSAETVAKVLLDEIIPRHGCPGTLLSDNGSGLVNSVVQGICNKYISIV